MGWCLGVASTCDIGVGGILLTLLVLLAFGDFVAEVFEVVPVSGGQTLLTAMMGEPELLL